MTRHAKRKLHRAKSIKGAAIHAMCGKKKKYQTEIEAYAASKFFDKPLRAYICPICDHWHLTHRV